MPGLGKIIFYTQYKGKREKEKEPVALNRTTTTSTLCSHPLERARDRYRRVCHVTPESEEGKEKKKKEREGGKRETQSVATPDDRHEILRSSSPPFPLSASSLHS